MSPEELPLIATIIAGTYVDLGWIHWINVWGVPEKLYRSRNLRCLKGMYDVERKHGLMRPVAKRDAATLIPIIQSTYSQDQ